MQVYIAVGIETRPLDRGMAVVNVCMTVAQMQGRALFSIQLLC